MSVAASVVQQSLRNQLRDKLKSGKDTDEIVRRVRESLDVIKTLEPKVAEIVRQCYGTATGAGFVLMTGIVACALISACMFSTGAVCVSDGELMILQFSSGRRSSASDGGMVGTIAEYKM